LEEATRDDLGRGGASSQEARQLAESRQEVLVTVIFHELRQKRRRQKKNQIVNRRHGGNDALF